MSQLLEIKSQTLPRIKRIALLVVGDLVALLLFVWIGRRNHALSITDVMAGLSTAAPFIIGWFLIAPWFGLFRAEVSQSWRKLLPRLLLAWVVIGGPLALVLRPLFLGRSVLSSIIPSFVIVTMIITTFFLIVWRLGYIWWVNRRLTQDKSRMGS